MNLIGHLACAQHQEPAFRLGSVLPDLLGMFARRPRCNQLVRFWESQAAPESIPPHTGAILAGIRFHHHVDARFHSAPLFRDNAAALRKVLQSASDEAGLKRFFAAHILLELFFDQLLLKAFPHLAGQFDELLAEGRGGMLWRFAAAHPDVDGEALHAYTERMLQSRFAAGYLIDETILFRVNRTLGRVGQRELNEPESHAVVSYFGKATTLRMALLEFVRAMGRAAPDSQKLRSEASMAVAEAARPLPWPSL